MQHDAFDYSLKRALDEQKEILSEIKSGKRSLEELSGTKANINEIYDDIKGNTIGRAVNDMVHRVNESFRFIKEKLEEKYNDIDGVFDKISNQYSGMYEVIAKALAVGEFAIELKSIEDQRKTLVARVKEIGSYEELRNVIEDFIGGDASESNIFSDKKLWKIENEGKFRAQLQKILADVDNIDDARKALLKLADPKDSIFKDLRKQQDKFLRDYNYALDYLPSRTY